MARVPIPRAVIDADVLYRRHPRNLLVWHALAGVFELHWSARILDETRRHLVERNVAAYGEPREQAVDRTLRRVTDALTAVGAGRLAPREAIAAHEPSMPNDPKDRHVLAAAAASGATVVVTTNVRDFAAADTQPLGITAQTPDQFLTASLDASTLDAALDALRQHASFHRWSVPELLALLVADGPDRPALTPDYVRRMTELTGVKPAGETP